ncbi:MAG: uncharacterized small protein (DUF1192 family) [Chlamydiales bacterium]|jgi:uncharacterized small protein (DUF1192 family)
MSSIIDGISNVVAILRDPNSLSGLIENEVERRTNEVRKKALQVLSLGVFISRVAINNLKSRITRLEAELSVEREKIQGLSERVDLLAGQLRSSEERVEELTRGLVEGELHIAHITTEEIAVQSVPESVLHSIETQTSDESEKDKELSLIGILSEAFDLSWTIVRFILSKFPGFKQS